MTHSIERGHSVTLDAQGIVPYTSVHQLLSEWLTNTPETTAKAAYEKIQEFISGKEHVFLDLSNLELESLPHIFHLAPFTERLHRFDISNNRLSFFPTNCFHLKNLRDLKVSRCGIEEIPVSLFQHLPQLTHLDLSYNHISVIPSKIERLRALVHLNLSHNPIHTYPETLLNLPSGCEVNFGDTHLSSNRHTWIKLIEVTSENGYKGPDFSSCDGEDQVVPG
jgi:Leucine-rich repeat (LRR) protein